VRGPGGDLGKGKKRKKRSLASRHKKEEDDSTYGQRKIKGPLHAPNNNETTFTGPHTQRKTNANQLPLNKRKESEDVHIRRRPKKKKHGMIRGGTGKSGDKGKIF